MSREPVTNVRRVQLGNRLRELRKDARLTQEAAAAATSLSEATISGIETGRRRIMARNVRQLCHAYGVGAPLVDMLVRQAGESEAPGWLLAYSETVPDWAQSYVDMEARAAEIWGYEPAFVPGLLQTADYVRAISRESRPDSTAEDLDQSVELRQARQAQLNDPQAPKLVLIIDEAVVRRRVGSVELWRAQLRHLIELNQRPNITVQVLPFSAGAHPGMSGAFTLLRYPDEDRVSTIYLESDSGGVYPDRPADLDRYEWMFLRLRKKALSLKSTNALLSKVVEEL